MDLIKKRIQYLYTLPASNFWPVGEKTGLYLEQCASKLQAQKVLEIGSSSGVSSLYLLRALSQFQGKLISIESNYQRHKLALESFEEAKVSQYALPILDHAPECFQYLNLENLDMVFVDCTKSQSLEIFLSSFPFLKKGGIFLVDNAISHQDAMQNFYDYLQQKQIKFQLLDFESGLIQIIK